MKEKVITITKKAKKALEESVKDWKRCQRELEGVIRKKKERSPLRIFLKSGTLFSHTWCPLCKLGCDHCPVYLYTGDTCSAVPELGKFVATNGSTETVTEGLIKAHRKVYLQLRKLNILCKTREKKRIFKTPPNTKT